MDLTAPPDEPYVAGIDTSLTSSGVTLLGGRTLSAIVGREGVSLLSLERRVLVVAELAAEIFEWVTRRFDPARPRTYPALVLVESPDMSNSYGGLVERTCLTYEVTKTLLDFGVPVGWVPSAVLKGYATGKGGGKDASKVAVREVATGLWPELGIDKIKPKKAQYDAADSAILAAMALDVLGLGRRVPDTHADDWLHRASIEYPTSVLELRYPQSVIQ